MWRYPYPSVDEEITSDFCMISTNDCLRIQTNIFEKRSFGSNFEARPRDEDEVGRFPDQTGSALGRKGR